MQKITRISRLLSLLFRTTCWVYPITYLYLLFFHLSKIMDWAGLGANFDWTHYTLEHRLTILALACVPMSIILLIFHNLAKLFQLYQQGYLFEIENIKRIRAIGIYLIASQMLQLIYQPLMTILLTFDQPPGHRIVSIGFGSTDLVTLMTGLVILTASWIVAEAHQLKNDAQLTI